MRKALMILSVALLTAAPIAPAAANDPGPCGEAPGPHCRPMDCHVAWDDSLQSDLVPLPGVPYIECYN